MTKHLKALALFAALTTLPFTWKVLCVALGVAILWSPLAVLYATCHAGVVRKDYDLAGLVFCVSAPLFGASAVLSASVVDSNEPCSYILSTLSPLRLLGLV